MTSSSTAMNKRSSTAARLAAAALALTAASAKVYDVSPGGLSAALDAAGPGDTIMLADGIYEEPIVTQRDGTEDSPITIKGGRGAVINYFSGDKSIMWSQKVVDIRHSWITLTGFTVDGQIGKGDVEEDFVDKCIWVESLEKATKKTVFGKEVTTALTGTVIQDMSIKHCGMECIRMRNFVTNSLIEGNEIEDCGVYDFRFQFDSVIGEAIYVGSSSNQWCSERVMQVRDLCLDDTGDQSNFNLIRKNTLIPRGNECVDIKEGSSFNVVEDNYCEDQRDEESGCYDSRGNENTFRRNTAIDCDGAGIRLGGHNIDGFGQFGVMNNVYDNEFNGGEVGSVKSMVGPQDMICGNSCEGNCDITDKGEGSGSIEDTWDQTCSGDKPFVPFIDEGLIPGGVSSPSPSPEPARRTTPEPATPPTPQPTTAEPATPPTPQPITSESYEALGCFTDEKNAGRIMRYKTHDTSLTTESCAKECEGYAFFGTQYGVECWCGGDSTDHVKHGKLESEVCDFDCAGNGNQTCGGEWAMSVYKYSNDYESTDDGEVGELCDGVLSNLGFYCCKASCGTCGGSGCSNRDGGSDGCCTASIKEKKKMCAETKGEAPCIMSEYE